jgi:hemin uptake protein HemP
MDRGNASPGDRAQRTPAQPATSVPARPAPLPSEQLLQGRRLVEITHNGEVYRLQSTRLGKLILTK